MRNDYDIGGIVAIIVVIVVVAIVAFIIWDMQLLTPRRQPLDVETETPIDSPFVVQDRHDDTRGWIEERLEGARE